jgi:Glycosyltransferase GT-D fold
MSWRDVKATLRRRLPASQRTAEEVHKVLRDIHWELREQRKYLEVLRQVAAADVLRDVQQFAIERELSFEQTMHRVIQDEMSFARFGDGEFRLMLRFEFNLRFQRWSPGLAADLRQVLTFDGFDPDRLLLSFPYPHRDMYWSTVWADIWYDLKPLLGTTVMYGSTHVTRPIFFHHLGQRGIELWRQVWEGRDVCVVTGQDSRFSLVPELFDNVAGSRFVHSTPTEAYADLPRLMKVLEDEDPDQLYLTALGPAGTLVAAWLSQMGRRAIDVGHINNSWANAFAGGKFPEHLDVRSR